MGTVEIVLEGPGGRAVRADCRRLLHHLLAATDRAGASVALLLAPDRAVRSLNRRFRSVDRATDVLAFPAQGDLEPGRPHLGEIAIAMPRAKRQARLARWPLRSEMALLVTHGFLHLLGYDHEADDGSMRRLERELLQRVAGVRLDRRALPWCSPPAPTARRRSGPRRTRS
jgi:probable rRNA maturation factor